MSDQEHTPHEQTRAALDAAVRAHAEGFVEPGEVIVAWLVVAGTRSAEDGGATITIVGDNGMPRYLAKGMLVDALDLARRIDADDDPDRS